MPSQYAYFMNDLLYYLIQTYGLVTTLDIISTLAIRRGDMQPMDVLRSWGRTPPEVVIMIGGLSAYQFFRHTGFNNFINTAGWGFPHDRMSDLFGVFSVGQLGVMYRIVQDLLRRTNYLRGAEVDYDTGEVEDQMIENTEHYYAGALGSLGDGRWFDRPDSP